MNIDRSVLSDVYNRINTYNTKAHLKNTEYVLNTAQVYQERLRKSQITRHDLFI